MARIGLQCSTLEIHVSGRVRMIIKGRKNYFPGKLRVCLLQQPGGDLKVDVFRLPMGVLVGLKHAKVGVRLVRRNGTDQGKLLEH